MKSHSRYALAYLAALCCSMCFVVFDCEAQTVSDSPSNNQVMRERIATIFRETLKQGEGLVEVDGYQVSVKTFVPPPSWCVDEIQRYGDDAITILTEYLSSDNGFEKYLAMRFLGLIGGRGVVEPLRRVALDDPSSSFRMTALLWLSVAPWDLAYPTIRHIVDNDSSPEVRENAKEILLNHAPNK
jgi:hypothetical protein